MTDSINLLTKPTIAAAPRRRCRRVAFSVASFLIFLELGLRLLGAIITPPLPAANPIEKPSGAVHVLCVGDSFTFGIGAPGGQSYPDALQRLLNETARPGQTYHVFNRGIPGVNSAMARRRLPADLARFQPDFVIVLVGNNNAWNPEGTDFLRRRRALNGGFLVRADRLLWSLRVYRLAKYLLRTPNPARPAPPETERSRRAQRAIRLHREELARLPAEYRAILERGYEHIAAGRCAEAAREFHKAARSRPEFAKARIDLADAFRRMGDLREERAALGGTVPDGREGARILLSRADFLRRVGEPEGARRWYRAAADLATGKLALGGLRARALAGLGSVALDGGDFAEADRFYRQALDLDPDNPHWHAKRGAALVGLGRADDAREHIWRSVELGEDVSFAVSQLLVLHRGDNRALDRELRARAARLEQRRGRAWVAYVLDPYIAWHNDQGERARALQDDLAAMVRICRASGARCALMVYPHGRLRAETHLVALAEGAPCLDARELFETREHGPRRSRYFVADGHLTAEGYALLAQSPAKWITAANRR